MPKTQNASGPPFSSFVVHIYSIKRLFVWGWCISGRGDVAEVESCGWWAVFLKDPNHWKGELVRCLQIREMRPEGSICTGSWIGRHPGDLVTGSTSALFRRRQWHPTPVLLPGKSHGRRSLEGCSPWGRWGSDTTERLHFHFSLPCIGEGNGNPLQCSCLENPRDGGAWWAAIYGVAQSRTQLKRPSSSSSALFVKCCFTPITSNYC